MDRLRQFDPASRKFPVRTLLAAKQPRSYSWRCPLWFDQGQEGRCVEFALAHEAAARPSVVDERLLTQILASRLIYWPAQMEDGWEGGSYPGASPQYEGTSVLAGVKVATRLGLYREYRWAFGLDDLILAVGYRGPAVLGVDWHEGMFDPGPDGFLRVAGAIAGGHAILCNAVSLKREAFKLHNSWGRDWGMEGEAWISFGDMDRLLRAGGEACIPSIRLRPTALTL